ncbi:MAG: SemiSWEET transporter [Flavobacteriaceae bacterium]|nr:SemiSWEET transporter [Flavobacteriaceae bacterium]
MNWVDILGLVAGICVSVAVIPQIKKAWHTKTVKDISPVMFGMLMFGVFLWIIYGIIKRDIAIIITNSFSLILNSVMLYLLIKYGKKNSKADF